MTFCTELIDQIGFSCDLKKDVQKLPYILRIAIKHIESAMDDPISTPKLCIIFPTKASAPQWLAILLALDRLKENFQSFENEIYRSHEYYSVGDKLILNDSAIVQWLGHTASGIRFLTKMEKNGSEPEITVKFKNIAKLKPAPAKRTKLSTFKKVMAAFSSARDLPADRLLGINSQGNDRFNKKSVCLAGIFRNYDEAVKNLYINDAPVVDYFGTGKIDASGTFSGNPPLLLTNDLTGLAIVDDLADRVSLILADGAEIITTNMTNFQDISCLGIPAVVISDVSETQHLSMIADLGFKIIDLTNESKVEGRTRGDSDPFFALKTRMDVFNNFALTIEQCKSFELADFVSKVSAIPNDASNQELSTLKWMLVRLCNYLALPTNNLSNLEIQRVSAKSEEIQDRFRHARNWLGSASETIEAAVTAMVVITDLFTKNPTTKYTRFKELLIRQSFDFLICSNDTQAEIMESSIDEVPHIARPSIILASNAAKCTTNGNESSALVVGWLPSSQMEHMMASYRFHRITFLFYTFEVEFFRSLCGRIAQRTASAGVFLERAWFHASILPQARKDMDKVNGDQLFGLSEPEILIGKNTVTSHTTGTVRAKAILFKKSKCLYASESHRFYVVSDLDGNSNESIKLHSRRTDGLKQHDLVALISTQRDILVEFVERSTDQDQLRIVKYWTGLWKSLLREHYRNLGSNFPQLVADLRANGCKRHVGTIRSWLQDDDRIGPDDDSDLISIALVTRSEVLYENIDRIRNCIGVMTSWRMRASDQIVQQIREQLGRASGEDLRRFANDTVIIPNLGLVNLLRVVHVDVSYRLQDVKFINRLLNYDEI